MNSSTSDIDLEDEGSSHWYDQYHQMPDFPQSQTEEFHPTSESLNHYWSWELEGVKSPPLPQALASIWDDIMSSETTLYPNNHLELEGTILPSADAVNLNPMLTSSDNPTPNNSLHDSPETPTTFSSYTDSARPREEAPKFVDEGVDGGNDINDPLCEQDLGTRPQTRIRTTSSKTRKSQQSQNSPLAQPIRCKWEGCRYAGSFKRESVLFRHIRHIHLSPGSYPCPVEDCHMVCNRADNLKQHMRNMHGQSH